MIQKKTRCGRIVAGVLGALVCVCLVACVVYFGGYYRADARALAALESNNAVTVQASDDQVVFSGPDASPESTRGLVFYPGANVEFTAYAPLMHALAADGWQVVLVKMPLNHAFMNISAADQAMKAAPQVERWFVGGHSLGGAMSAMYADDHADQLQGLVLMAAFSTKDLTDTDLDVYCIHGTEDGVLNRDSHEKYQSNVASLVSELEIAGGNHALFGSYGFQKGDNAAKITSEEQIAQTVAFLHAA